MQSLALRVLVGAISVPLLSSLAAAQDVDVPGNLTMVNSTATEGNILKGELPFLHNYGMNNTFLGINAGNLTMSGASNTATGFQALQSNTSGFNNTALGSGALLSNTTGFQNTASGLAALFSNTTGNDNTATGTGVLLNNTTGNGNTASGAQALVSNESGSSNTASGVNALFSNNTGNGNTAIGFQALQSNTIGGGNTAIGSGANVSAGNLTNATAIGAGAIVDASDKIRLGNGSVTVVEGPPYSPISDRKKKENLRQVDGEEVLTKIRALRVTSWNYIGQDAKEFRHYGPMAQDFFTAFGHDGLGTIGTPTTNTSTDIDGILMIAAKALEKRTVKQSEKLDALRAENAELKGRLEVLERRVGSEAER